MTTSTRRSLKDEDHLIEMARNAERATEYLKAFAQEARLMIICHLASGEKSVSELEDLLSLRQSTVSQQLARLRMEGIVKPRRDGKAIYYKLCDRNAPGLIAHVYDMFCNQSVKS